MTTCQKFCRPFVLLVISLGVTATAHGQLAPEIGYVYPPSATVGSTVDVHLGGYDWTPDMQLLLHDPRVQLEVTGAPGPVLVPEPPYWFGAKARENDPPLSRQTPARLTVPADMPVGPVLWQAANANGATKQGILWIGAERQVVEAETTEEPQPLESLPVAVVGQIRKIEEIDRYRFSAPADGLITIEPFVRRLQSSLYLVLQVRDAQGEIVAGQADTTGRDRALTFAAKAGIEYTVALHDFDFRGDASYVYRLAITSGPRVLATRPAAIQRGARGSFVLEGYGIATGVAALETFTCELECPAGHTGDSFETSVATPAGQATVRLPVSDLIESQEPATASDQLVPLSVPCAVTGQLAAAGEADRYQFTAKPTERWRIDVEAARFASPLDVSLAVLDAEGKVVAEQDDSPASTDVSLEFTPPAEATYTLRITDRAGQAGEPLAGYRLALQPATPGFALAVPPRVSVPLGEKAVLDIKVVRRGGFTGPIQLALEGLPPGMAPAAEAIVPENAAELKLELTSAADSAVTATLARVVGTAQLEGAALSHTSDPFVATAVMKPPFKITPEGLDDVRTVPRGSTFPAPLLIERSEGFSGEIMLEQTSQQQRSRQGITGPEFPVAPGLARVEYPVFLPEWLETTKTSRIILNGVTKLPDPQGNVRHVVAKMDLRIGMLPKGALFKLDHSAGELEVRHGEAFEIPLAISRAAELSEPITFELVLPPKLSGAFTASSVTATAEQANVAFPVSVTPAAVAGEHEITIRGTALRAGGLRVVSETSLIVEVK